jgi:hypothetical protein
MHHRQARQLICNGMVLVAVTMAAFLLLALPCGRALSLLSMRAEGRRDVDGEIGRCGGRCCQLLSGDHAPRIVSCI